MSDFERMLQDFRLTTAEIIYHMPDHPFLLQTYLWQEYDKNPYFPELRKFLEFWERELDGRLHTVKISSCELIKPSEINFADGEFYLN
ncbi:usg protein [Rickettsiales bacterium]|nr:usg protein [Rickettsiales bacterium]